MAYAELAQLFDPASASYHSIFAAIAIPDLVDAAARTSRLAEASALIDQLQHGDRTWRTPVYEMSVAYAAVILASDDTVEELFTAASTSLSERPYLLGRLYLAMGVRLRRSRRVTAARSHLRHAAGLLRRVGAHTWSQRARDELAASGDRAPSEIPEGTQPLTPQESRVTELAASGLTNRDIAERLFLSHRTVAAHLYSAFRKLGISTRDDLATLAATDLVRE